MKLKIFYTIASLCIAIALPSYSMDDPNASNTNQQALSNQLSSQLNGIFAPAPDFVDTINTVDSASGNINELSFIELCSKVSKANPSDADLVKLLFYPFQSGKIGKKLIPALHEIYHNRSTHILNKGGCQYDDAFKTYLDTYFGIPNDNHGTNLSYKLFLLVVGLVEKISLQVLEKRNAHNSIDVMKETIELINQEILAFKGSVIELFNLSVKVSKAVQEELFSRTPICKALIESNKVVVANLLLAYAQTLLTYNVNSNDLKVPAEKCEVVDSQFFDKANKFVVSHFASINSSKKNFIQQFVCDSKSPLNSQELEYLYLSNDGITKSKNIVLQAIQSNNLANPIISLFLRTYGGTEELAQRNFHKGLKDVLSNVLTRINLPGCKFLCSYSFGPTLAACLEIIPNLRAKDQVAFADFKNLKLFRDEHIFVGNVSRSGTKPSGSHVLGDSEEVILYDDTEINLGVTSEKLPIILVNNQESKFKINTLVENKRPKLIQVRQESIYNPANEVTYFPLSLCIEAEYHFKIRQKRSAKNKYTSLNLKTSNLKANEKIERFFLALLPQICKKLDIEVVKDSPMVYTQDEVIVTCRKLTQKRMGSSYFSKELTDDKVQFFSLMEQAFTSKPVATMNAAYDDQGVFIQDKEKLAKALFSVSDNKGKKHLIEMYLEEYSTELPILSIVTAFEHIAHIELKNDSSYPNPITDFEKKNQYQLSDLKAFDENLITATEDQIESVLREKKSLVTCHKDTRTDAMYIGLLDVDINKYYTAAAPKVVFPRLPLLVKVPANHFKAIFNKIYNSNTFVINLDKYGSVPANFMFNSSQPITHKQDYKIVRVENFLERLKEVLTEAIINNQGVLSKDIDDTGKIRIIFYFTVPQYVGAKPKFYAKDRLMALISASYDEELRAEYNKKKRIEKK